VSQESYIQSLDLTCPKAVSAPTLSRISTEVRKVLMNNRIYICNYASGDGYKVHSRSWRRSLAEQVQMCNSFAPLRSNAHDATPGSRSVLSTRPAQLAQEGISTASEMTRGPSAVPSGQLSTIEGGAGEYKRATDQRLSGCRPARQPATSARHLPVAGEKRSALHAAGRSGWNSGHGAKEG
jgi:hypothetical protein